MVAHDHVGARTQVATFASDADYEIYAKHPKHKAVIVEKILPCIAPGGRAALQFQS